MRQLEESLHTLINNSPGKISLYIKYLANNKELYINSEEKLKAASIIKLPILCELYRQVKINKVDLNKWLKVNPNNIVQGSGILKLLNSDTQYTIYDLAKLMIIISDNSATNEIVDLLGWENIEKYMGQLSLTQITFRHKMMIKAGRGDNLITAKDIGLLFNKLYKSEIYGSNEIIEILKQQQFNNYIPKLLPKNIEIAHKTGELPNSLHDAGIIYSKNPFIFVFLSEDIKSREKIAMILRECVKMCFDFSVE
jgi:beta-lactamase class A